ncbi:MAG TPA: FkbM family methyltransferase [Planctomycetota bacterium]|nr:FkbM family methyltransferase [Planctomycetota bacterium]
MKVSDVAAWWRLRKLVREPWAAGMLRKNRAPGLREIRLLDGGTITIRGGTPDTQCFHHIFGCDEYGLDALPPGTIDTVVDVGAHIGLFTVRAAKLARCVIAIEPVTENFQLLERNVVGAHLQNVCCRKLCLSEADGTIDIVISGRNDGHSIYGNLTPSPLSKHGEGAGSEAAAAGSESVPAMTLESIFRSEGIDHCDFLKLDCEGAEYTALMNAPREIIDRIGRIAMEYHPVPNPAHTGPALAEHLRSVGFHVEIRPSKRKPTQGMMFCHRRE